MEHKGTVYFFTGLSGAGKTTVGSLFYRRLKNTKPNAVYLDGLRRGCGLHQRRAPPMGGADLPGV